MRNADCPYCGRIMIITSIDIGIDEPMFMTGYTCDCEEFRDIEAERSVRLCMEGVIDE